MSRAQPRLINKGTHKIRKNIIKMAQVGKAKRRFSSHDQVVDENFPKIENRLQVEEPCAQVGKAKRRFSSHDQVVDESFSQIALSSLVEKSDTMGAFAAVQTGPNISPANFFGPKISATTRDGFSQTREGFSQEETKQVSQGVVNPSQEETKQVPQGVVNPSHKEDQDSHKGRGLAPGG